MENTECVHTICSASNRWILRIIHSERILLFGFLNRVRQSAHLLLLYCSLMRQNLEERDASINIPPICGILEDTYGTRTRAAQRHFSVKVWAGILRYHLIGPYLSSPRLNGSAYLIFYNPELIEETRVPQTMSLNCGSSIMSLPIVHQ